jgi:hypothetical protein
MKQAAACPSVVFNHQGRQQNYNELKLIDLDQSLREDLDLNTACAIFHRVSIIIYALVFFLM